MSIRAFSVSTKSFEPKVYEGFYINKLPFYKKLDRLNHLCEIEDILKLKSYDQSMDQVSGLLIFTFLISEEYLDQLQIHPYPKIIVTDSRKSLAEHLVIPINSTTKLIHPPSFNSSSQNYTFHPKLIIIKYRAHIRISIGTGNLLECDWNDYGNALLIRNCRLKESHEQPTCSFMNSLLGFIKFVLGVHFEKSVHFLGMSLEDYVWETPEIRTVYSIPLTNQISQNSGCAFDQIRECMNQFPPAIPFNLENMRLIYVTSFLNALKNSLLRDLVSCFMDDIAEFEQDWSSLQAKLSRIIRVIYPTKRYVDSTHLGSINSQCLFLKRDLYESFKFNKSVMRQFEGNRLVTGSNQVTPHLKFFVVKNQEEISDDTVIYVGSHNLTASAWGSFSKDWKRIRCLNYELGLLFLSQKGTKNAKMDLVEKLGVNIEGEFYGENDTPFFN